MSQETHSWLNRYALIGFTNKRGHAWHYRAAEQGDEPNHYPMAIPVEDVRRRLFYWEPVEGTVNACAVVLDENGATEIRLTDPERKAIMRAPGTFGDDDEGAILGVFKSGYQMHSYSEWLLETVASILDDELSIGSAILLQDGAVACVSVEVPENITTPEGVEFRPNLLAATSYNGTLSTTFARVVTNTICDNTMSTALAEKGQKIKIKHSRYSTLKLTNAREALAIVHTIADEFAAQVAQLCNVTVSDGDWAKFLDELAPTKDAKGEPKTGRGLTMAENLRAEMERLWQHDTRVSPWRNTAFGVVQAVNTHVHHGGKAPRQGTSVAERNALRAITGGVDKLDQSTLDMLNKVLA